MVACRALSTTKRHCRCTVRLCGKRFKGVPGVTKCPACDRVGRLDKWAAAKPWRANLCDCSAYPFRHRMHGGACYGPSLPTELPGVVGLPF